MKSISTIVEEQLRRDYPYDDEYTLNAVIDSINKVSKKYKIKRKK